MTRSDSRQRFIDATAELLREKGFSGMGLSDVIERSGAPKGSLYFHFPDGKDELCEAAVDETSTRVREGMRAALQSTQTMTAGLELVVDYLSSELERTGFQCGCVLGTVAAEAPRDAPRLQASVRRGLDGYQMVIRESLVEGGVRPKRAAELADFLLAGIEGAILLSKAKRSIEPLRNYRKEMARLFRREKVK